MESSWTAPAFPQHLSSTVLPPVLYIGNFMRGTMEELHEQPGTLIEGKPKKVRFKLASSYSGRVLKHVYEDGQELDSPEEQYPHSFMHTKMEMGHLCGLEDMQDQSFFPPTGLIAQRINVYRGVKGYNSLACGDLPQDNKVRTPCTKKDIYFTLSESDL